MRRVARAMSAVVGKVEANKMRHVLVLEHVSPATRLLEKRRLMFEVQEALEAQKAEFNRKEEMFRRREEGLKKKDLELQESLIRFSKFLQENDSKRTRAEKKAADEVKMRNQKEAEVTRLNETLAELRKKKVADGLIVRKMLRNQQYLETVIDTADEYHEINDLLLRYATLKATNADLRAHAQQTEDSQESTRVELQAYVKARTDELLQLNNQVSRSKKALEERERETLAYQTGFDATVQAASKKTLEVGQVRAATENLFLRAKSRSRVNHPDYTNPLEQITVVGDFMSDLGHVLRQWQKKQNVVA